MTMNLATRRAAEVRAIVDAIRQLEAVQPTSKQIEGLIDIKHTMQSLAEKSKLNAFNALGDPSVPMPMGFHHPKHTGFGTEPIRANTDPNDGDDIGFPCRSSKKNDIGFPGG